MRELFLSLAVIMGVCTWLSGIGFAISILLCVMKVLGLPAVSTMSYWLPLQCLTAWVFYTIATAVAVTLAK